MFVTFCPRKMAMGRIARIAKKPTMEATSQFIGQTEKNKDLCSNDKKVTIALINMVTKIADNNVMRNNENSARDMKYPKLLFV
mgnify:CR=1 FL=1